MRKRIYMAMATLMGVAVFSGGLVAIWRSLPEPAGRAPASKDMPTPAEEPKGKSLDEVKAEIETKAYKQKKAKEWIWAEEGHTDKVIEAFHGIKSTASQRREDRVRMLTALSRTIQPRDRWPAAFNDQRAMETMNFLMKVMTEDEYRGAEKIAALQALVAYGLSLPEMKAKAARQILEFHAADTRPGPRGECFSALARLGNAEGLKLSLKALRGSDVPLARAALYALDVFVSTLPGKADEAKAGMHYVAQANKYLRPLAVKLLARHGDRKIASMMPKLLADGTGAAEVEAAAHVAAALKLKEYRQRLLERAASADPMTRQNIDNALKSLDN